MHESISLGHAEVPTVKSFKAINYEGSKANIEPFTQTTAIDAEGNEAIYTDGNYYNLTNQNGWKVDSFDTDLQNGFVPEFIQKENKWFNFIHGEVTTVNNLDTTAITGNVAAFNVQGIGFILEDPVVTDTQTGANINVEGNNPQDQGATITGLTYDLWENNGYVGNVPEEAQSGYAMYLYSLVGTNLDSSFNNQGYLNYSTSISPSLGYNNAVTALYGLQPGTTYTVTVSPTSNPSGSYTFTLVIDPNAAFDGNGQLSGIVSQL